MTADVTEAMVVLKRCRDALESAIDLFGPDPAGMMLIALNGADAQIAALASAPSAGQDHTDLIRRLRQHDGHLGHLVEEAADALERAAAPPPPEGR